MTSPLSFSSRLCSKLLKRLLYSCQCLLTCVCLLHIGKVCRWKFFHCLRGFLWQFTQAYLSVKWVINPPYLTYNFSFSFFFNFFTDIFCMWNLSWLNMSALTLIWQAQQQQQQQQQCKCCTGTCLRADSSQSPHSLWCICCCSHPCSCQWWFSSLCWSAAACSVCSLFSDNGHCHTAQCECFVCTALYHTKSDENSSAIVHQCNSDSELRCVGFCQLYQLSGMQYGILFKMLSYIRTFWWVLQ